METYEEHIDKCEAFAKKCKEEEKANRKYLTHSEVLEMSEDNLGTSCPHPSRLVELAKLMDLDFDEEEGMYYDNN